MSVTDIILKQMNDEYVCLKIPSYYPTERVRDSTEGGLWVVPLDVWNSILKLIKSLHWKGDDRKWTDRVEVYTNPTPDVVSFIQSAGNKGIYDLLCNDIRSYFEHNEPHEELLDMNLFNIYSEYGGQASWEDWIDSRIYVSPVTSTCDMPDE